jgi:beta-lactamase regulating signal transducer with metallopeptidase domain
VNHQAAIDASPWIDAIGSALLSSVWQGAAIALVLAIALAVLRRASSQARYLAACAAIVLLIALPLSALFQIEKPGSTAAVPVALDLASPTAKAPFEAPAARARSLPRKWNSISNGARPFFSVLVPIWATGAALCALRLAGGWVRAMRWVRCDTHPLSTSLTDHLRKRLGVHRRVALLESAYVNVPMVIGWLRPVILVPVAALTGLNALELDAILAHEFAHIRRHDYLVNLVQCIIEALMFYHPATWWISGVIRREREHCCDDLAVRACRDRIAYARALAIIEELRAPAFSLSTAASGGNLPARIRRILKPTEESMKPSRVLVSAFVVLALFPIWFVRAGTQTEGSGSMPQTQPDRVKRLPDHSLAGALTSIEDAPAGSYIRAVYIAPDNQTLLELLEIAGQSRETDKPGPTPASPAGGSLAVLSGAADTPEEPPTEAEVLARIEPIPTDRPPTYKVERKNTRVIVEEIADKADPPRNQPLVGLCQLVHRHYKCTVYYDDVVHGDYPIPFHHVDHKVEVVYVDKDFLRQAQAPTLPDRKSPSQSTKPTPSAKSSDDRIEQIIRDVERLSEQLRADREKQERVVNQLMQLLESVKVKSVNPEGTRR